MLATGLGGWAGFIFSAPCLSYLSHWEKAQHDLNSVDLDVKLQKHNLLHNHEISVTLTYSFSTFFLTIQKQGNR